MTKPYLLFVFLLLSFSFYASAQNADNIKDTKRGLIEAASDTARVNALNKLSSSYATINTDTAILYGEKAIALATKINYENGIGHAYSNTGWAYFHKGDYKTAEAYMNKAVTLFEKTKDDKNLISPLSDLGTVSLDQTDYVKSLSYFLRVLKISQQTGMRKNEGMALYNIGKVYNRQKNFPAAREYFLRSYNLQKSLGNNVETAESLMSLGNTAQSMNDYAGSLKYYNEAVPYSKKEGDAYTQGLINENMGLLYFNHKEFEKAMQHFLSAKDFYTRLNGKTDLGYILADIAETDSALNNLQKSIDTYNEALQLAREIGLKDLEQGILSGLSNVYLKKEDYKNAYQIKEASNAIKDSLFTLEKSNALMQLQTQFETEKKKKENQLLKTNNDLANANLKKNREWLLASGIVLLLLITLLIVIYRNRKIKIRNITMLKKQAEEILRINTILELRALKGQMDTHFIFNCMASLQALIWTNKNDEANDYLSKFSRLLRMVLENSELPVVSLDEELDMLKRYLDLESIRLKKTFNYKIIVEKDLFTEAIYVPTLIIQPFVENAIWHGLMAREDDRLLTVEVKATNKMLTCIVEDNGIGRIRSKQLRITATHNSKGIKVIEERLRLVREQASAEETGVEIIDLYNTEQEAAGTRVIIHLPVKQSLPAEEKPVLFSDIESTLNA